MLVAGLGLTGQSVLRYLQAMGESAYAFDTRAEFDTSALEAQFSDVKFATGTLPARWKFEQIVLSPGIALAEPWVQAQIDKGVEVIGDIELFARAVGAPVISITGSNGKSTVTTLVGECLAKAGYQVGVGGNIGTPALDLLIDDHDYEVYVLELSSFQLETTYSLHSISATVLNISEDHMDRYDSIAQYTEVKMRVFDDAELAILPIELNQDYHAPENPRNFSLSAPASAEDFGVIERSGRAYLARGTTPLVACDLMKLQGVHHQLNALAAMALCQPFDVGSEVFLQVLAQFSGLPYRTQWVLEHQGVNWVNDSKGTNVGATVTAIRSLGQQAKAQGGAIVLIAGGVGKEADFQDLAPAMGEFGRTSILFGRDRALIAQALHTHPIHVCETLEQAIEIAIVQAQAGDTVLFSPACASFDQFSNYMARGQRFNQLLSQALGVKSA